MLLYTAPLAALCGGHRSRVHHSHELAMPAIRGTAEICRHSHAIAMTRLDAPAIRHFSFVYFRVRATGRLLNTDSLRPLTAP